ncbi:MAG: SDR family oxidoreductase [Thermoguttaceae bacterium]
MTHDDEVRAWAAEVLKGGSPDLLVNNAATINRNAPLWKVPAEEFSQVIDVNVKGVVNVNHSSASPTSAAPTSARHVEDAAAHRGGVAVAAPP